MGTLMEMTANIVSSHASKSAIAGDDLIQELQNVYLSLQRLEKGITGGVIAAAAVNAKPALTFKQAFHRDQVGCMICGKAGMKSLARHLGVVHHIKPAAYRRQFGIPSGQALTASDFSEARRKMASERGLADNLVKARAQRAANALTRKAATQKEIKKTRSAVTKAESQAA